MSKVIILDTNLIFSALLTKSSRIRELLLDESYTYYAPNFIISEIYKHQRKLFKYTSLPENEFFAFFNAIIENVKFVPLEFISVESRQIAYNLCYDIDLKDIPFISLSIELKAPLWTGDKKLRNGLTKKGYQNFYNPDL